MFSNIINIKYATSSDMNIMFFLVFIILCVYFISKICSSKGNILLFLVGAAVIGILLIRMKVNINTNSSIGSIISDFKNFISTVSDVIKNFVGSYLH